MSKKKEMSKEKLRKKSEGIFKCSLYYYADNYMANLMGKISEVVKR